MNALKNFLLVIFSLTLTLTGLEFMSRVIMPVQYGHHYIGQDGAPIEPKRDFYTLKPSIAYRQVTHEFDKPTTHTASGFRGPYDFPNPDVIFIGDSFTYGTGLADEETIPYLFCAETGERCVNLGRAGTATLHQIEILRAYLDGLKWTPKEVRLIMLAMTTAQMAGNDINGNLEEKTRAQNDFAPMPEKPPENVLQEIIAKRKKVLEYSNIARITYYMAGPALRAMLSPEVNETELALAIGATQAQLARLQAMAETRGFRLSIYVVHPMQDLMRGTWQETESTIKRIAPGNVLVVDTAHSLVGTDKPPQDYYYPIDGHLNPEGAARVAKYMAIETDKSQ